MASLDPVQLLQQLIRCPSVTPADGGCFDVLEGALKPLGFTIERLRFEGNGSYAVDNLFATRGAGSPHLLFNGHIDVVPPGDRALWTHDPFGAEIAGGRIYGRGVRRHEVGRRGVRGRAGGGAGGRRTSRSRSPPMRRPTASTARPASSSGRGTMGTASTSPWSASAAPPTRVGDSIKIGRRGSLNGRITVTGVQGHVAYPKQALNPLPVAAGLVTTLSGKLDDGSARFPPSNLEFTSIDVGNPVSNVIPASVVLRFNVRYNERWTPESLEAAIREAIAGRDAEGTTILLEVVGTPSRSFLSPQSGAVELLAQVIADGTGARPEFSTAGGTSDARFIAQYCPVVEFGLPGPSMHKADESVALADVTALTALYGAFLRRYFAEKA